MLTIYGIKNCDTIKKAKKWLDENSQPYQFHDYRVDGIDKNWLINAVENLGWDLVLNKRGTTYRQLSDEQKQQLESPAGIDLLVTNPAMIKRPILQQDDKMLIGFKVPQWEVFIHG
ncbi:MAG: ArsC family reductase [Aestuariibacter sp.]